MIFNLKWKKAEKEQEEVVLKKSELSLLDELEAVGIDTKDAMRFMGDDIEQYREILQLFAEESTQKKTALVTLFLNEQWKDYTVLVHSMKNNMRSLGMNELADMAFELEKAAKASDVAFITSHHEEFMMEWRCLFTSLKNISQLGITIDWKQK